VANSNEIARRIAELENLLLVKRVDWIGIYRDLRAMDLTIGSEDDEEFEKRFVERNGTEDEFVANKEREWKAKNPGLLDMLQPK
jgi:hypothetical protein